MIFKTGTTGKRLRHRVSGNNYRSAITLMFCVLVLTNCSKKDDYLQINGSGYFEKKGLNIFVFNSWYNSLFSDSKNGVIEIIQHEVRNATNGDIWLCPTPEQWDPIPEFINRRIDTVNKAIEAFMKYPRYDFIYNRHYKDRTSNGVYSGTFDDRWAFTSKSSALNYGSAAALAASSRVLRGELAKECIATAEKVWDGEQGHKPYMFRFGNTTGGPLEDEMLKAACELYVTTGDEKYKKYQ